MQLVGAVKRAHAARQLPERLAQAGDLQPVVTARPGPRGCPLVRRGRAGTLPGQVGPYVVEEADALQKLHGEERALAHGHEVVEAYEMGMSDIGQGSELALQPVEASGIQADQGLERNLLPALAIEGAVHHAHAAGPQATVDPEAFSGAETHGRGS